MHGLGRVYNATRVGAAPRKARVTKRLTVAPAAFTGSLLSFCAARTQSALDPQGPISRYINTWWWVLFSVASFVVVLVTVLLLVALFRKRKSQSEDPGENQEAELESGRERGLLWFVGLLGVAFPVVVLGALMGFNIYTENVITAQAQAPTRVIQVIGHRWWWEVIYPQEGITTANELHIPAGESVQIKVTSADVIHSFWVPQLNGKIDTIPGQTNTISIQADKPGAFRGQCGEYCGLEHAKMAFWVVADALQDYQAWVTQQRLAAPNPKGGEALRGQQVFLGSACVYCHAVKGTNASSRLGPDLTHIASRRTLGAGALPNTEGNLAGWIVNPQTVKPGNKMPPMYLESKDLQALLAYFRTLR